MENTKLSFSSILTETIDFIKNNLQSILKSYLVILIISSIVSFLAEQLTSVVSTSLLVTFTAAIYLCDKNKQEFSFETIINLIKEKYLMILLLTIVTSLIYTVGFILLIIPGIYLVNTLQFTLWSYYFKDDLKAVDSLGYSKSLTDGRWWQIFGISIVFAILMILASVSLAFFAVPISMMFGKFLGAILLSLIFLLPTTLALSFQMHLYFVAEKTKAPELSL